MSVQARFYVSQIIKTPTDYIGVTLLPVVRDKSNGDWAKYTPSGRIEMNVSTESGAAEFFDSMIGKDVAITFEPRDPDEVAESF